MTGSSTLKETLDSGQNIGSDLPPNKNKRIKPSLALPLPKVREKGTLLGAPQRRERQEELRYTMNDEIRWRESSERVLSERQFTDKSPINYSRIRELQANNIRLNCTRCAVRAMKYLVSGKGKYLKLPFFPKRESQTQEQVVSDCNKDDFLVKHNKEIKEIDGGYFNIQEFERKFNLFPMGTIAFLFGALRIEGEDSPIGHTLIAYKTEGGIKYLDSTTPEHFDLAFEHHESYFKNGFFSLSKQKQAKWIPLFEGMIVSDASTT